MVPYSSRLGFPSYHPTCAREQPESWRLIAPSARTAAGGRAVGWVSPLGSAVGWVSPLGRAAGR